MTSPYIGNAKVDQTPQSHLEGLEATNDKLIQDLVDLGYPESVLAFLDLSAYVDALAYFVAKPFGESAVRDIGVAKEERLAELLKNAKEATESEEDE